MELKDMTPRARWAQAQVTEYLLDHPDGLTQPVTLALQRLDDIGAILTPERAAEIEAEARAVVMHEAADAVDAAFHGEPFLTYPPDSADHLRSLVAARTAQTSDETEAPRTEPLDNLTPQQCPEGIHPDWAVDSEDAHACPWCETDRLRTQVRFLVEQVRRKGAASGDANRALAEFLAAPTPCSRPNVCEDGGDPCDRHEREWAHAEGEHALCGAECDAMPDYEYGVRYGDATEHVDRRHDRADAEQALTRWQDMRSDAVLVQRTVRYGPWRPVEGSDGGEG